MPIFFHIMILLTVRLGFVCVWRLRITILFQLPEIADCQVWSLVREFIFRVFFMNFLSFPALTLFCCFPIQSFGFFILYFCNLLNVVIWLFRSNFFVFVIQILVVARILPSARWFIISLCFFCLKTILIGIPMMKYYEKEMRLTITLICLMLTFGTFAFIISDSSSLMYIDFIAIAD